jgi:hypothetical protein
MRSIRADPMLVPIADAETLAAAHARSRAVAAVWPAADGYRQAQSAFAGDGLNAAEVAARAAALLADDQWIAALIAPLVNALAQDDFFQPPFRVNRDQLRIGAALFDHPLVTISATILSADMLASLPPPRSVVVSGRLSVVRCCRSGGATLHRWQAEPIDEAFSAAKAMPCRPIRKVPLNDGDVLTVDGRTQAMLIDAPIADVVTITATVRIDAAPFMREYAIGDGRLLCVGALDDQASRTQMLLSFLRHHDGRDAGPSLAAASHDSAYFVRWSAMREWLALDVAAALPRLREMVDDPNAEVRAAAAQMLPLAESWQPCPV